MKIAFVGAGKMAGAMIRGLLRSGVCAAEDIAASSRSLASLEALHEATGIRVADENRSAVAGCDVVVLGVKPGDVAEALASIVGSLRGKLLISVASGLSTRYLEERIDEDCRVVRAMPNIAAMAGRSVTAICGGTRTNKNDLEQAGKLFEAFGSVHLLKEAAFDGFTGLAGSGPAYLCLFLEALADGGVASGLPRDLSQQLALEMVAGTIALLGESGMHPAALREMVTSPAGTTIEALSVLEQGAVRGTVLEAVRAAAERSRELGQ